MSVRVRELACWGFDAYPWRPACVQSFAQLRDDETYAQRNALQPMPGATGELLTPHAARADLLYEMRGLDWTIGLVDLRALLSFQRRLSFDPEAPRIAVPGVGDFEGLVSLCFGAPKTPVFTSCDPTHAMEPHGWGTQSAAESKQIAFESRDPNLQVRVPDADGRMLSAGSPFMEVAEYRDRWFLRDGYHRAYALLQAGIAIAPAVVVRARTLAELGATQPRFFGEDVLFGARSPRVVDFLNDDCCVEYQRPRLLRRLHVTVEESFVPETVEGDAG